MVMAIFGNLGLGVQSAAAKLDVAGTVKIADGTQGAGKVLTSDANGLASWQTSTGGGTITGTVQQAILPSGQAQRLLAPTPIYSGIIPMAALE